MPVTRLLEHERNKYISYDPEAHRYTYKPDNKIFRGITGWIDSFSKEPFIASEVAERVIKNPNGEYYGWTPEDVIAFRSEEHTSELQSRGHLVCRLLLEKKKKQNKAGA